MVGFESIIDGYVQFVIVVNKTNVSLLMIKWD